MVYPAGPLSGSGLGVSELAEVHVVSPRKFCEGSGWATCLSSQGEAGIAFLWKRIDELGVVMVKCSEWEERAEAVTAAQLSLLLPD